MYNMSGNYQDLIDVAGSLAIGGFLGWFAGGCYNVLQGRSWTGEGKLNTKFTRKE